MKLCKFDDIISLVINMKENILADKSIDFAARIVKLQMKEKGLIQPLFVIKILMLFTFYQIIEYRLM